jgi:glucokinase
MVYALGLDIGGTHVNAGLVLNNKIVKKVTLKIESSKGKTVVINNIIKVIEKVKGKKRISGIGIGCPGPLDYKKGIVLNTPNIPLKNVNIVKIIKNKFKTKVRLDNDANCFVLGEAVFGAGKAHSTVFGVTLGTGVGAGIVINKKIFHGRENASEFGHAIINFNGPKDKARIPGSVEAYCSAQGVMRIAKELRLKAKSSKHAYDLALKGNTKAKKVFEKLGYYLGISLANAVCTLDPDIIIIGGKVADSWQFFSKPMKKSLKSQCFLRPPRVVKAKLSNAAILGAAQLLK